MSPLLYRLSYRAAVARDASTAAAPGTASGRLLGVFLLGVDQATGQTLALLVTFVGIGVIANVLIVYIVAQVLAERKQNRERRQGQGETLL